MARMGFNKLVQQLKYQGKGKGKGPKRAAARDPRALAAWIGRKKYGKRRMAKAAARGIPAYQAK